MTIIARNGRWGVRVYDPRTHRQEWVGTFSTRRDARAAEAAARVRVDEGRHGRGAQWTVRQWSVRWQDLYPRAQPTTNQHNRTAIRAFVAQHGDRRLRDITPADARDFAAEHPWRARVVSAMLADAIRDGRLERNPFTGLHPRTGRGRRDITPLTAAEVARLADIARDDLGYHGDHFAALIIVAAWTGLRPGELGGLEWTDVDLHAATLWVRRQSRNDGVVQHTKTGQARRITVAPPAVAALAGLPRDREHVFQTARGHRFRPNAIAYYWRPVRTRFARDVGPEHWLAVRLARDPADHLDPYELRHFCGSWLADRGVSARDIAAHLGNSVRVCERTYLHDYEDAQRGRLAGVFAAAGSQAGSRRVAEGRW